MKPNRAKKETLLTSTRMRNEDKLKYTRLVSSLSERCPEGFDLLRSGQCLKYFSTSVKKSPASSSCESIGTRLVSLRTRDQENAVRDYLKYLKTGALTLI